MTYLIRHIRGFTSFQSTPSGWRVTVRGSKRKSQLGISIHTLRVEGDSSSFIVMLIRIQFQSTPSGWRVTPIYIMKMIIAVISIHTLRVEGDSTNFTLSIIISVISIHTLRVEGDF